MYKTLAKLIAPTLWGGVALIYSLSATQARSADINWNNSSGGNFEDTANWDGGTLPSIDDVARFNLSGSNYTVNVNSNTETKNLDVIQDNVGIDLGGNLYNLAVNTGENVGFTVRVLEDGSLNLTNGEIFAQPVGARGAEVNGTLTVGANMLLTIHELVVPHFDSFGRVNIIDGGQIIIPNNAVDIAEPLADQQGIIFVSGTNSRLDAGNGINIGNKGNGTLAIEDGGFVEVVSANISGIDPNFPNNFGIVTVSGSNSQLSIDNNFDINKGNLIVDSQGLVSVGGNINHRSSGLVLGDGTIQLDGTYFHEGTISPGLSIGNLSISGNYQQEEGSLIDFEIGGTTPVLYDQLLVTGNVNFLNVPSTFQLSFVDGFNPMIGDEFLELITFGGSFSGNLDNLLITSNNDNFIYETVLGSNSIGVRVASTATTPEPSLLFGFLGLGTWLITSRKGQ
ncbi:MAG: hypothetical protein AB4058_18605 [Microcystaceae cyanobacterium]